MAPPAEIMAMVSHPHQQRIAAALAILAVLAFGLLPAEHVHIARTHDAHHSDLVHRHFEPHHPTDTRPTVDHADPNQTVRWLTASFSSPESARHVWADNHLVQHAITILRPEQTFRAAIRALFVSVHDPPWATPSGLRAPPACLL
jgi:hypothetical protein